MAFRFFFDPTTQAWVKATRSIVGPENGEELIRLQYSRFYNQAVLDLLESDGVERVYVPHINGVTETPNCTPNVAGKGHELKTLRENLIKRYCTGEAGEDEDLQVIPKHPFCCHVVRPFTEFNGNGE